MLNEADQKIRVSVGRISVNQWIGRKCIPDTLVPGSPADRFSDNLMCFTQEGHQ